MSIKLPSVTGRQVRDALIHEGWIVTRQRGSHLRMEKDGVSLTIVDHGARVLGRFRELL